MTLFLVRHEHTGETCPAADPKMGAMLLQHISEANASKMGINIHGQMGGGHTFVAILDAENRQKVEEFMSPFAQAGSVEIIAGITCAEVVERSACGVGLTVTRQDEPYYRVKSDEAAQMLERDKEGTVIVDVRRDDEWVTGHVKGAIHIPIDDLQNRIDELPRDKTLLFICAGGMRSGQACEVAATMGYPSESLYNVEDGTPTWIERNHPASYGDDP